MMTGQLPEDDTIPNQWLEKWQSKAPVTLPITWSDDPSIVTPIPRKPEIEEYNSQVVHRTLEPLFNQVKRPFI
jgi:acetoin utilization protein AcuC